MHPLTEELFYSEKDYGANVYGIRLHLNQHIVFQPRRNTMFFLAIAALILVLSLTDKTEGLSTKKYVLYLFSYFWVYPVSYPLLLMLTFAADDPSASSLKLDLLYYTFVTLTTITGAILLNYYYKRIMKVNKNTKTMWQIFFAHLILIPGTYLLYNWLSFHLFEFLMV